jgi:hypothetical protein
MRPTSGLWPIPSNSSRHRQATTTAIAERSAARPVRRRAQRPPRGERRLEPRRGRRHHSRRCSGSPPASFCGAPMPAGGSSCSPSATICSRTSVCGGSTSPAVSRSRCRTATEIRELIFASRTAMRRRLRRRVRLRRLSRRCRSGLARGDRNAGSRVAGGEDAELCRRSGIQLAAVAPDRDARSSTAASSACRKAGTKQPGAIAMTGEPDPDAIDDPDNFIIVRPRAWQRTRLSTARGLPPRRPSVGRGIAPARSNEPSPRPIRGSQRAASRPVRRRGRSPPRSRSAAPMPC